MRVGGLLARPQMAGSVKLFILDFFWHALNAQREATKDARLETASKRVRRKAPRMRVALVLPRDALCPALRGGGAWVPEEAAAG